MTFLGLWVPVSRRAWATALTSYLRGGICFTGHFATQHRKGGHVARLILVADDSPIIQRKVQRVLQDEGFEAETVSNGVAAVKRLSTLQPLLVLADVSLPGRDGYEVCEFVKTSVDLLSVPVLLMGSDLEPYDERRGARVRADGIIKKPFTDQELIAMVTRFTGPSEARASRSTLADTIGSELQATPPGTLPAIPLQPSPEPAPGARLGSIPEPQLAVPPEDVAGGSSEAFPAHDEPFPEFALGGRREVEEARSQGAEVSTSREVEPSRDRGAETESSTLPLLDSSAPVPEPSPVIAVPISEPAPEGATELAFVGSETGREVGKSSSREGEQPRSRGVETGSSAPPLDPLTFRLLDSSTSQLFHPSMHAAAAGAPSEIGLGLVYTIVHRVVTKMAPRVLSPQQIEELVRVLTQEITSELDGTS